MNREFAIEYAKTFFGVPYEWGGDNAFGLDCSGLVCQILKGVGILPHKGDLNSEGLYYKFKTQTIVKPRPGALVFYGDGKVTHVAMLLNPEFVIESGGGRSTTKTKEDADKHNAFVRMRPYTYRSDLIAICDPFGGK